MRHSLAGVLIPLLAAVALIGSLSGCETVPKGPYGVVEASTAVTPIDLHRVVLQNIDGHNIVGSVKVPPTASLMIVDPGFIITDAQSDFPLPAGEHTLQFSAVVDRRDTTTWLHPTDPYSPKDAGVLKLTVEPGKRYVVAARVNPARPEEWQAVVYRVEDLKNYHPSKGG